MNWYKTSGVGYMSIGHSPSKGNPVYLWWWDGSFHVQATEDPNWGHQEVVPDMSKVICRGRYDPATNTVSMTGTTFDQGAVAAIKQQWPGARPMAFRAK